MATGRCLVTIRTIEVIPFLTEVVISLSPDYKESEVWSLKLMDAGLVLTSYQHYQAEMLHAAVERISITTQEGYIGIVPATIDS